MFLKQHLLPAILFLLLGLRVDPLIVNSLADYANPAAGIVTLRSAFENAASGDTITFDERLDGKTIQLSLIGEPHSILKGEVMGMREEPSGLVSYLVGYFDRDYGASSLYARKNLIIDASALPNGVTIEWTGQSASHARVMCIYGDLTLKNVTIRGGSSVAHNISATNAEQPWSLARGGGLAVWGTLQLENSEVSNNHCISQDPLESRDRGAFGGGVYADIVEIHNSVIGGNSVTGPGAAGGGVYSVGGAETEKNTSKIEQSVITGNRISGLFTYGGGVFSDGGGIGNAKYLEVTNSTIVGNLVEPLGYLPQFLLGMGYWRGGGIYVSNGFLTIQSSTIVENEVYGYQRTDDLGKSNLAGGVAATIGNAHAVEEMVVGQSILAGNTVTELNFTGDPSVTYQQDIFSGSLFQFKSYGYNRIGVLDFSQILVPVGVVGWKSLARKHFPQAGDAANILLQDVIGGKTTSSSILSVGVNSASPAVLYYQPADGVIDQIPQSYFVDQHYLEYSNSGAGINNFLEILLGRLETTYNLTGFKEAFQNDFENFLASIDTDAKTAGIQPYTDPDGIPILTLADTQWFGPVATWPSEISNYSYIQFWHRLDTALKEQSIPGMGDEGLNDARWMALFSEGVLVENTAITMYVLPEPRVINLPVKDQLGNDRSSETHGDIGSIESSAVR